MTTFGDQVREVLADTPHAAECASRMSLQASAVEYFARQAQTHEPFLPQVPVWYACTCDREARIAERVVAALDQANASDWDDMAAVLRVLRGGEGTR